MGEMEKDKLECSDRHRVLESLRKLLKSTGFKELSAKQGAAQGWTHRMELSFGWELSQLRKGQEEEDAGQVVFQIVTPTLRQMS